MKQYIVIILILAFAYLVFSGASFIVDFFPKLINTQIYGSEYCFKDIDKTTISVASQGAEFKYTKEAGDELCFRTKDKSFVERINQQIQERKEKERLAEIEANKEIIKTLIIVFGFVVVVALVIIILSNRNNYY
jgi:hypothetical protein